MNAVALAPSLDRSDLVLRYYPLARSIACRIYQRLPKGLELDDLVSAGVCGLIEAIDRYDPTRKVPFETYAKHRIHGAVVDTLRSADWVPRSVRRKADLIDTTRASLTERLGRSPSREEMARTIEVDIDRYESLVKDSHIQSLISLDAPVGEGNATPLVEQLGEDSDLHEQWHEQELKQAVVEGMKRLPERERIALAMYYLNDMTLAETGKALGVSESRACQLCGQGIKRLRRRLAWRVAA